MRSGQLRQVVKEGALALEHGWDPLKYLSLTGIEKLVAREILQEAVDNRATRDRDRWKNMQAVVQNGVAKAFGGKK